MKILITGGAGCLGSQTCIEFIRSGFDVIVIDNFSNSNLESIKHVESITGGSLKLEVADLRDEAMMNWLFIKYQFDAVLHLACVENDYDAIKDPLYSFDNNINGCRILLSLMIQNNVNTLLFKIGQYDLITTDLSQINTAQLPAGQLTKLLIEKMCLQVGVAHPQMSITKLSLQQNESLPLIGEARRANNVMTLRNAAIKHDVVASAKKCLQAISFVHKKPGWHQLLI